MKAVLKKGIRLAAGCLFLAAISSSVFSQIDQSIYYKFCTASPHEGCFIPLEGAVDSVGRDVSSLSGKFRFCLQVDTVDSGIAPIRALLVLDNSGSMCSHYGPDRCCTSGDSSGFCSKNDPTNMRVAAAHQFVDSLRAKSPESEVGVLVYVSSVSRTLNPLSLDNADNVEDSHAVIDQAGCTNVTPDTVPLAKTQAIKATNLGIALQRALTVIDQNYASIPAYMDRHIILLTDGAWDDLTARPPLQLYQAYRTTNPDRPLPTVHGVFISDSATHVAHGYPKEGCADSGPVDLAHLKLAADSGGGLYFGGTTPQTIVQSFQTLLDSVTQTAPQRLNSLFVVNTTNGDTATSNKPISVTGDVPTWETTLEKLALEMGPNKLTITRNIYRPGKGDTVITTNVTIIRSDRYREVKDDALYQEFCELVQANIKIVASPETQVQNKPFDVKATISGASNFTLDSVQVRIFTRFPDGDNGAIATFHLDGNLTNSANPNQPGLGTPGFSATEYLFGSGAINSGSFTHTLPQIANDFVIEEWVKPGNNTAAVLFSGGGIEIGVNAGMKLYLKTAASTDTAVIPLDDGVWSHVGVARTGGKVTLFVNGVAVSNPFDFTAPIAGGVMTITTPARWLTDEVRFSNVNRIAIEASSQILAIPTVANTNWSLKETASSGPVLKVAPGAWINKTTLDFTFASPVAGRVIVNIRQKQAGDAGTGWSKNSNPVFVAADVTGPFVKQAILSPGPLGQPLDTLRVEFSEPLNCAALKESSDPSRSFIVFRAGNDNTELLKGSKYALTGCPEGKDYITEVMLLVPVGIDPDRDSLRLTNVKAADSAGNPPLADKKGDIVWGESPPPEFVVLQSDSSSGNPMQIPDFVVKRFGLKTETGKVVAIKATRDFDSLKVKGEKAFGIAAVYDAVGNVIANELPVKKATGFDRTYYIHWDGANRQKRQVGVGAYLVRISYTMNKVAGKEDIKVKVPRKR